MPRRNNGFGDTEAVRHRIKKIDIYEVTKEDIETLSNNNISDLFFELAIAFASICASFLCSLLVCNFNSSPVAFVIFFIIVIVTSVSAIICGLIWWRKRKNKNAKMTEILTRPGDSSNAPVNPS